MAERKVLIICQSIHHNNTLKIAKAIGNVLNAEIKKPSEVVQKELNKYDVIGLGSGIYLGKHHKNLLKFVDKSAGFKNKKVFVFSTSGISNNLNFPLNITNLAFHFHSPLKRKLIKKDAKFLGEFSCRGFDTYGFLRIIGGISKGKPNKKDLAEAKNFAMKINKAIYQK
ncbi:MAG: flavodoxin family protein [Nanoarchaeota archaeon]